MTFATLRAQIAALLALLIAAWPGAAPGHVRYFCRMMDQVVDSCCCRSLAPLSGVSPDPEAGVPDCCERLTQGALANADTRRDVVKSFSAPLPLAASQARALPGYGVAVVSPARERRRAVAARGPPLFLSHCALLI